jgi:hypothetical protein
MPKSKILCAHCDAKLTTRTSFCPDCRQPTMFATVEERTAWELEQWAEKRASRKVVAHVDLLPKPKRAPAKAPAMPMKVEPIRKAPIGAGPARAERPKVARAKAVPPKAEQPKLELPKREEPKLEQSRVRQTRAKQEAKAAPAKRNEPTTKKPPKPLVVDLRGIEEPRDLALEQVQLLRELLFRVTSIEEKLNGNGSRARRLRLLKR